MCGILPFKGETLQQLKDEVLTGRVFFPYFMSLGNLLLFFFKKIIFLDCKNLIEQMLTVDLTKRPTIEQIKRHSWMNANLFEKQNKFINENNLNNFLQNCENNIQNKFKPHPQILKCMNNMGIEVSKIQNVNYIF